MKTTVGLLLLLAALSHDAAASEPIVGGPCDGCEAVFVALPAQLDATARIAPAGAPGEPLIVEGVVHDGNGAPVKGVIVYAYQTDAGGIYPAGATRHGSFRGWAQTDAQGRYRFDTIRPGAYPGRDIPQHIHMHIIEPGKATYYIDDIVFTDDPLLTAARRQQMRHGRGGYGDSEPTRNADKVWLVRRDIALGKNIPGYVR